jgi:hypothetical protein
MNPTDQEEFSFLTSPGAVLNVALWRESDRSEIRLYGNRSGLLALANVLLWLLANSHGRELLSLHELPFANVALPLSIVLRVTDEEPAPQEEFASGLIVLLDGGEQYEWRLSEDELKRVALDIHSVACVPEREYSRLLHRDGSEAEVEVRMTDATTWIRMRGE